MLELLLMGGGGKPTYYDSGPGPQQLLFGDINAGFFGEVSQTDLLSSSDLRNQITDLTHFTVLNTVFTWLKFAYNGKYLFVAKKPVFSNITWSGAYVCGLIYGTDDNGVFNNGLPTNQIRLVTKGPYRFKVRTITNDNVDPSSVPQGNDITTYRASEWTDLIYRVTNYSFSAPYNFSRWATYSSTDLGVDTATYEFVRETVSSASTKAEARGGGTGLQTYWTTDKNVTPYYWRPVLEVVSPSKIFSLRPNSISVSGAMVSATTPLLSIPAGELQRLSVVTPQTTGIKSATANNLVAPTVAGISRLTVITPVNNTFKPATTPTSVFNP